MEPVTTAALISLGAKGLSKLFGGRSDKKKQEEQNRSTAAGLTIQQKQREDARRARLAMAQGLLGGVPATTAGGGVNTNVGLDPALVEKLMAERTYDFAGAMPRSTGGVDAFLSGLFGGAADVAPYLIPGARDDANDDGGSPFGGSPRPAGVPAIDLDELRALGHTPRTYA